MTIHLDDVSGLPAHCVPADNFLLKLSSSFHVCIPTYLAFVSTLLGSLSILSWLFAQIPQIYKNYKIKSTAGLSVFFLVEWLLGDTTNLVGAVLTGQATWQVIVAAYYTFVDCILVWQYLWYEKLGHGRKAKKVLAARNLAGTSGGGPGEGDSLLANGDGRPGHTAIGGKSLRSQSKPAPAQNGQFSNFHFPSIGGSPREKPNGETRNGRPIVRTVNREPSISPSPRTVLLVACLCAVLGRASPVSHQSLPSTTPIQVAAVNDPAELAGRIISWLSTALYLGSRLPQLIKNYRRRSTAGLSPTLFLAAFCGNLFYSSSLLTNPLAWDNYPPFGHSGWAGPEGSVRAEWALSATPFFLGAFGVLGLDAAVGIQFMVYGDGRKGRYTPRIPVVVETPPTRDENRPVDQCEQPSRTRILAVPHGRRPGPGGATNEFEAGSWRRVSGWMRGWVPSFSPDSWNRKGYMDEAAAAGRSARPGAGEEQAGSVNRVRAEADEWERRQGNDSVLDEDGEIILDEDRPLLERDDIPGSCGEYGSL